MDRLNAFSNSNLYTLPYKHVIIDNFFKEDYAELLWKSFPTMDDKWIKYWNPIEKKYALNNFDNNDVYRELFEFMQTSEFIDTIKHISDIPNLENDPYLHGAGVHYHPTGGKLDMHLDYSIHPITQKERRVNLIIFMNKDWKESYNGDLQLWDASFTEPKVCIYPIF